MRVGFHLHYKDNDLGQCAIRLAEFARSLGHDVAFHTIGQRVPRVSPKWDHMVETEADCPYLSWVKDVQVLVAMEAFGSDYMRGAARAGCKIVLFAPWNLFDESHRTCYEMADEVICPVRQGVELLQENWGLKNCQYIPWDNGLPATRKSGRIDPVRIRVMFPLHGWQAGHTHPGIVHVVWRLLHKCPFVDATVLYCHRGFNAVWFKTIRAVERMFRESGQFRAIRDKGVRRDEILMMYGRHDLVAWAAENEGIGGVGLDSLSMGTPVVAYDVAPQNEFLYNRKNAVLVPCELRYNFLGVPWVLPDFDEFERSLVDLVSQPKMLEELRKFSRYGMALRREKFVTGWKLVLDV